jgi:hypothetical protein
MMGPALASLLATPVVLAALALAPATGQAAVPVLSAQPPLVAVQPGAEPRCPSAVEVEAALLARVPGVVVAFDRAAERRALLLLLAIGAESGAVDLTLVDADGRVRLRRSLAGSDDKQDWKKDCGALAETAALMVERYLVELDERATSLARATADAKAATPLLSFEPQSSPWTVAAGSRARLGAPAWALLDFGLRLARQLDWPAPLLAHLRFGIGPSYEPFSTGQAGYGGSAVARRWPLEAGLAWRRPFNQFELQAGGGGGFDITYIRALGTRGTELTRWLLAPQVFCELAGQRALTRQVYLRLGGLTTVNLSRYDFTPPERAASSPLFSLPTQRIQVRLSLDLGMSL